MLDLIYILINNYLFSRQKQAVLTVPFKNEKMPEKTSSAYCSQFFYNYSITKKSLFLEHSIFANFLILLEPTLSFLFDQ